MLCRTAALTLIATLTTPACTVVYQEQSIEKGEGAASSFPPGAYPDADESTSGDEGDSSSTGGDTRGTDEPDAGSTTLAMDSTSGTSGDAPIETSTGDDASSTTAGSSSTGEQPIEEGTSTGDAPIDETTTGDIEGSTTGGEPEPPPVQCEQLNPAACGVGLCFGAALVCSGDEAFVPGGALKPGLSKLVPSNANQQRVVHVLDLPAGQYNVSIAPLTGGTTADYRLYNASGVLKAAGSPAGVAQIAFDQAAPAVFLLVVGELAAKPMTHEVKVAYVPTLEHNDLCDTSAQCLSNFCRASAFDAAPRCLTPCTRATVLDCKAKALPGLCVETGVDKTPLCAGNQTFGVDGDNRLVKLGQQGWNLGSIAAEDDVDVHLIDLSAAGHARLITNGGATITGTWLDAAGKAMLNTPAKPNMTYPGPALGKGYAFLLVSSGKPGLNGYRVEAAAI